MCVRCNNQIQDVFPSTLVPLLGERSVQEDLTTFQLSLMYRIQLKFFHSKVRRQWELDCAKWYAQAGLYAEEDELMPGINQEKVRSYDLMYWEEFSRNRKQIRSSTLVNLLKNPQYVEMIVQQGCCKFWWKYWKRKRQAIAHIRSKLLPEELYPRIWRRNALKAKAERVIKLVETDPSYVLVPWWITEGKVKKKQKAELLEIGDRTVMAYCLEAFSSKY